MKIIIEIIYNKETMAHSLDAIGIDGKTEHRIRAKMVSQIRFYQFKVKGESAIEMLPTKLIPSANRGYCFHVEQPAMVTTRRYGLPSADEVAFLDAGKDENPRVLYLDAEAIGLSGPEYKIVRGTLSSEVYSAWRCNATGTFLTLVGSSKDAVADIEAEQARLAELLKQAKTPTELEALIKDIEALPLRRRLLNSYWMALTPEQYAKEKDAVEKAMAYSEVDRYQLLDELRSNFKKYLATDRSRPYEGDGKTQIAVMRALWKSFKPDKKPVWLPLRDIDKFELKVVIQAPTKDES